MALVTGPWTLLWGGNEIDQVEELEVDYDQDSEDYSTLQHQTYELDGAIKASVTLTVLGTDLAALAMLLPQNHVNNGGTLSTGERVNNADGATDVAPGKCNLSPIYNNLDIISCANPGQVFRLVNARTRLDDVEFDDKIRKIMIKFIGEPAPGEASVQFFKEGTVAVVS